MNWNKGCLVVIVLIINHILILNRVQAQGTAFSYQGRLNAASGPASGSYDFQFGLYATNAGGVAIAGPVTNSAVVVSNGLFLAAIDFGSVFSGTNYWLDVAVRTNGAGLFTELNPRQLITPAPSALFANTAGTAGTVSGLVAASQVSGILPLAQLDTNALRGLAVAQVAQTFATSSIPVVNITGLSVTNISVHALGGTNDDTAAFAAAFNSGVPVICPMGDFNVTNIVIHNDNEVIYGYGCRLHMAGNATGYVISTRGMTNVCIAGLALYGGIHQSPGWMMGSAMIVSGPFVYCDYNCVTLPLGMNTPPNARSGFYCNMQGRSRFVDLTANGFNVAGFYLANPLTFDAATTPVGIFQNNFADWCYLGFELPQSIHVCDFTTNNVYTPFDFGGVIPGFGGADYTILDSPVAHNCTFGINDGAWNVPINNPQISGCAIGICIGDNTHNTITGGSLNHESGGPGLAYYISGVAQGPVIVGQQILDNPGNVYVTRAGSVTFSSCQFNPGSILATNLTGAVVFMNCITNGGAITTDNTGLSFVNCYGPGATNTSFFGGNNYRSAVWSLPDLTNGMNTGDFKIVSSNGQALVSIWMTNGAATIKQLVP